MDGSRFDQLARSLVGGRTRRGFLRGLAALAAGAVAAGRAAAAACPAEQYAGSGRRCLCRTTGRPPVGGVCPCGAGQTSCDGACVDLSSDPANCGACGAPCVPGPNVASAACLGGACAIVCATDYRECQGLCIPATSCCADSDCNDGNVCTVDICGPVSGTCFHFPIDDACTQCGSAADCGGGPCCSGRCCAPGATCSTAATGEPTCCLDCEGSTCCDEFRHDGGVGGSGGYQIQPAYCITRSPECASCAPLCVNLGICSYVPVPPGPNAPPCGCGLLCSTALGGVA